MIEEGVGLLHIVLELAFGNVPQKAGRHAASLALLIGEPFR